MSSAAAEAAINLDYQDMPELDLHLARGDSRGSGSGSRPQSWATEEYAETPDTTAELKKSYLFDSEHDGQDLKPSSSRNPEDELFDSLPVLEKGDGHGLGLGHANGHGLAPGEESLGAPAPTFAITPFVLSEPVGQREGGWNGWTCVAGSWLIRMSIFIPPSLLPLLLFAGAGQELTSTPLVFATSGYANAFGVRLDNFPRP